MIADFEDDKWGVINAKGLINKVKALGNIQNITLRINSIGGDVLMDMLFDVVSNMQSHELGLNLYPYYTDEELYQLWRIRNVGWYYDYGPAPLDGKSDQPFSQLNLLKDIIHVADTTSQKAAVLRFGHEVCVMPLACLLELGNCGAVVDDVEQLDAVWRNYDIFPMGCNVQLVFYRPKKTSGKQDDILVKALLNEREMSLPVPTTQYPYYRKTRKTRNKNSSPTTVLRHPLRASDNVFCAFIGLVGLMSVGSGEDRTLTYTKHSLDNCQTVVRRPLMKMRRPLTGMRSLLTS